ncbi:MAG: tRNA pseudouridine(55) synthase TruB [Propionivibrio sp.]|nr:tRNA pseudouridine(55) synthase TruB [Propionivibrio sp.]
MTANPRPKRTWQRVDGVLLLDKPQGMTSNAALQSARRLYSAAKAGHTGTLDPMATGLLPLCFGEATKFSADLLEADKTYEAEVLFGVTTNTGDADGEVLERSVPAFGLAALETAMQAFRGTIRQIPPMYSALKKDGQPLYRLARQGVEIERDAREVTILELRLLEFSGDRCRLRVTCSKGTYIRTLAEDLGRALACGAHLTALRRVAVGSLSIERAVTLDTLDRLREDERSRWLLPPDSLLQSLPEVILDRQDAQRFSHGNPVVTVPSASGKCRVYCEGRLLGVGTADGSGTLQPSRLVASN